MSRKLSRAFRRLKQRYAAAGRPERAALLVLAAASLPVTLPLAGAVALAKRRARRRVERPFVQPSRSGAPDSAPDPAHEAAMAARPDTFALVRVIGNDLPPRHAAGQSRENLAFILAHEPALPGCRRLWIVNRILDAAEEARIVALLEAHGEEFRRIPFEPEAYARVPLDFSTFPPRQFLHSRAFAALEPAARDRALPQVFRLRNAYAMHNNGARNAALDWGRELAKWVLPFDGNCFFAAGDWDRLVAEVAAAPDRRYFVVPMARLGSNDLALAPLDPSDAAEEPQVLFRSDAALRFDEAHPYGRRPKVELLARLGVAGPWDRWTLDPWDLPAGAVSPESRRVGRAGLVRRLASGRGDLEVAGSAALKGRGTARADAIVAVLRAADRAGMVARGFDPDRPLLYRREDVAALAAAPEGPLAAALRAAAAEAMTRGPFSVTQKGELPPGGDLHDYYHPSPYWWPNPRTPDGLPYVQRDGERLPGTVLYAPESDLYDRTRLQRMFDDALACALAWAAFGMGAARDHARRLVETWFLDPATAMTPHLRFAQVRRGHAGDEGSASGVIEFKDLAYLLDAVRLLNDAALSDRLRGWLGAYADWLDTGRQGREERRAPNNHGTFFDLQRAAIAAFLGDTDALSGTLIDSLARLDGQFDAAGAQPHELSRTLTRHYCAFNLQGWLTLHRLYQGAGIVTGIQPEFAHLARGVEWFLSRRDAPWTHPQIAPFDADRLAPLALMAEAEGLAALAGPDDRAAARARPVLHPHDGVPPFWPLLAGAVAAP